MYETKMWHKVDFFISFSHVGFIEFYFVFGMENYKRNISSISEGFETDTVSMEIEILI